MYLWLIAFFILFVSGVIFFIYGIRRNSGIMLLIGSIFFLTPLVYLADLGVLLPLIPPVALIIVYVTKRILKPAQ